jgi:transcriptional regulator with XRE-family HTH domain
MMQAYLLTHCQGYSQEDAAKRLGITQPALSQRLAGLKALRPELFDGVDLSAPEQGFKLSSMQNIDTVDETKIVHKW